MASRPFNVKIWGARGSMSSSGPDFEKYGGNTACVEVRCGEHILIFDAGSGIRLLGNELAAQDAQQLHLFFSHCHYDHISGFPFFAPLFSPNTKISVWSGHLLYENKTLRMIQDYLRPPFFPVGPEVFSADISYRDFEPLDVLRPHDGVEIATLALNHHDGCIGYRVNFDGRSFCYITDTAHILGEMDETVVEFVSGSELIVYDATYTDDEFPQFRHFGHSTWQQGIRVCEAAGVEQLCIFHHRPSRTDEALDEIAEQAKAQFANAVVAREGLSFDI